MPTRPRRRDLLAAALLAIWSAILPPAGPAAAQDRDLAAALRAVPAGGVLSLPGGDWGELRLRGPGPAVIRSADPADPARFSGLDLKGARDLALEAVELRYDWARGDPVHLRPFHIADSRNIRLSGLRIDGDRAGGGDAATRGFPSGLGLVIEDSARVTLEDSRIATFHRGLLVRESDEVTVRGNELTDIRSDGMDFVAVQGVRIIANHLHDFARSLDSKDHADMIQFWTRNTARPSTGIVIRDNVLNSGRGAFTQSIFMRNEEVDKGRAGAEMFYRDVTIEGNVIVNAHRHGISLGETRGAVIRSNTLVHNPLSAGPDPTRDLWLPRITVAEASQDIAVENNIAATLPETRPGWRVAGNVAVQPHARLSPGHYAQVFEGMPGGDPADPASYAPRPGGPAEGAGAARLRAR